ncbi:hypothetical protein [Streptomyces sp. NPDC050704]|uniref:hypothetical protein n=1 Tax=Streptomyces sp. NPDC050704 TaxID=3157219 RepID=UPI003441AF86
MNGRRRVEGVDRPRTPGSSGAWDARSEEWLVGAEELAETEADAQSGETKVVDVRPGETRVADVQLGEVRVVDARPSETGATEVRSGETGGTDARLDEAMDVRLGDATDVRLGKTRVADAGLEKTRVADPRLGRETAAPASVPALDRSSSLHTNGSAASGRGFAAHATEGPPLDRKPPIRRGAADPVKALIHRHRELCRRAVDPLEIAAGLEAHGVTDRTATRFRHRDVFSLAEEMYARVPRDGDGDGDSETAPGPGPETPDRPRARADWAVLALLPGTLCAATVTGLRFTEGRPRLAVTVVGVLAVALGLRAALRRGPLHATRAWHPTTSTRAWTCWLLAYALLGDGLLTAGIEGGPDGPPTGGLDSPWPIALASIVALTTACAPAAWYAHLFAVRARRKLALSRGLEEFAASVKPLLLGVFALFLCTLGGLLALSGKVLGEPAAYAGAGALGALLLLARLLTVHGFTHAPAVILALAGTAEAVALASVFAGRLPGFTSLAEPAATVADTWGPGAVPALVCGAAALVLLIHATRTLTRASAHAVHGDTP